MQRLEDVVPTLELEFKGKLLGLPTVRKLLQAMGITQKSNPFVPYKRIEKYGYFGRYTGTTIGTQGVWDLIAYARDRGIYSRNQFYNDGSCQFHKGYAHCH